MQSNCIYLPYSSTGYFSKIVIDYLQQDEKLKSFFTHPLSLKGIENAIENKKSFAHRSVLTEQLQLQYEGIAQSGKLSSNIQLLSKQNTFTITTAHQPNIFLGPLYVIYKILHTIKLANELTVLMPQHNFVPVFYMGSEDADIDELGNITIDSKKYEWQTKQTGAVGRMKVDKAFRKLIEEMQSQLAVQEHGAEIITIFKTAYTEGKTIQQATLELINILFGEYGLVVLIPDNAVLKKIFQPIAEKELKEQFSHKAAEITIQQLGKLYKVQAGGRELNLFYLIDDKRERIEVFSFQSSVSPQNSANSFQFSVPGLNVQWKMDEILEELNNHPERFSTNVILRGLFQETILPNIAFIGGGG
ncbi:MAG: bacillithiol biosynthesis BshC, partial [Parafilimonas sp.]